MYFERKSALKSALLCRITYHMIAILSNFVNIPLKHSPLYAYCSSNQSDLHFKRYNTLNSAPLMSRHVMTDNVRMFNCI